MCNALADDHYGLATAPVIIVEVPPFNDRDAERGEKSWRNRAELGQGILFVAAFDVTFTGEFKSRPKLPASRQGTLVPSATPSTPGPSLMRRIASR